MSLSALGLGLVSPTLIGGALLLVVTLGGGLIQRQCTVMEQDDKIEQLEEQARKDQTSIGDLRTEVADVRRVNTELKDANTELAKAAQQQSALNALFADAMTAQDRAAQADKAKHARELQREKATTLWLSDLIKRNDPVAPGQCEAAIALGLVRKALRGEAPLEPAQ